MYIFKNALISITRNKGRNLLIGIIIVVISCATTISLAIRNSANSLIDSYSSQYEVTATIGMNREAMKGEMKDKPEDGEEPSMEDRKENMTNIFADVSNITVEQINSYGDSDYVKDYYYQVSIGVNGSNLEKVSQSSSSDEGTSSMPGRGGPGGRENFQNVSSSDFTLIGYSTLSAMEEFISGKYTITDGEVAEDIASETCVVNAEFATLNNLSVGSTITLVDPDNSDNTVTLTVTGIFEEESDTEDMMGMFSSSANNIITNTSVIEKMTTKNTEMKKSITPTFVLTSKDVIEKFSEELTDKGLSEYLTVNTNLDQVASATSTISNVSTFATTFLVITLIIGAVVLLVINMINIRERKYEIGVLRTIGMKKNLLTLQFMSELMIVTIVALLIGAGIGSCVSVDVSNHLLKSEITSAQEEKMQINENFGGGKNRFDRVSGVAEVQAFDSIDAVVSIEVLGQLLVIGILLSLVSSIASMVSIQKFSPLTILKERS